MIAMLASSVKRVREGHVGPVQFGLLVGTLGHVRPDDGVPAAARGCPVRRRSPARETQVVTGSRWIVPAWGTPTVSRRSMISFAASLATSASTTSPSGRTAAPRMTTRLLTAGSSVRAPTTSSVRSDGVVTRRCSMEVSVPSPLHATGSWSGNTRVTRRPSTALSAIRENQLRTMVLTCGNVDIRATAQGRFFGLWRRERRFESYRGRLLQTRVETCGIAFRP